MSCVYIHVPGAEMVREKRVVMVGGVGGRGWRVALKVVGTAADLQVHCLAQQLRQSVGRQHH